ncbi:mitochondrial ribosomal subunit protein-domain-containing protein [Xylariaceae sp. FL0662B]|nr:mitochondrial ribosomal subunit protein-domain-containing protein [Xylariaceae sp. FL0662B]
MASAVQSLRVCLRAFRQPPATRKVGAQIHIARRALSSTSTQWRPASKKEEDNGFDVIEAKKATHDANGNTTSSFEEILRLQEQAVGEVTSSPRLRPGSRRRSFWYDEEQDPDLINDDIEEDEFDEDDIMGLAHGKLEEFREYREYARIAAWEMPLLSKLARPFEPPSSNEVLRFRFTSYMGEFHPAENKVVVEFSPQDLPLDDAQQLKLKKLLGPRYNPETDIAKMSCEQFEHQAQNKRYLGDLVDKLIARAKDPSDMFEDVPLDTRHHTFKVKPKFPKEWRITEERRKFIEDTRQKSLLLDQSKEEAGQLIDGKEKINQFFNPPASKLEVPEYVKAKVRLSPGRPEPRPSTRP